MFIFNLFRGFCMALADCVPGVSGGTIAFILGFYDKFITSLDHLFTGTKAERLDALKFLIKIGIGWAIGAVLGVLVLTSVFESHIYAVSSMFLGFIVFSIPLIVKEEKEEFMKKYLSYFTKGEIILWVSSVVVISVFYAIFGSESVMNFIASLIGVTSLIFLAKGNPFGNVLMIIFSLLYTIISYSFSYYGEMITYMFMTTPIAGMTIVSWIKNPYKENEVRISKVTIKQLIIMMIFSIIITGIFYFILKSLNTENLIISTISITTSFIAGYLTYLRSPYYALGYAANDIILIVLCCFEFYFFHKFFLIF